MEDFFSFLRTLWNIILIIGWVILTGTIGIEMGVWLGALWVGYYIYLLSNSINHVSDLAAGNFHIPTTSHDTGVLWILNGATDTQGGSYITFAILFMLIVSVIGGIVGGRRILVGNFWFWIPILLLPIYMYNIGLLHFYPGGSSAFVADHYTKTCAYERCKWTPATTTQPF